MHPPPAPPPLRPPSKRPSSAMMRSPRSTSRVSQASKPESSVAASRASDDESRTAVRVAIRVRPPLQPSDPGYDLIPQRFRSSTAEVTSPSNIVIQSPQGKKVFVFDRVFGPDIDQQGVWAYISDCVDSFVQGYNVSILAYGQSGSGKSYTMGTSAGGEQADPQQRGIVPRAAAALFTKLSASPRPGLRSPQRYSTAGLPTISSAPKLGHEQTWQLRATYVEIYNEQLRDLLLPETVSLSDRPQISIREDTKGRILLTGLTQVDVNSVDDLLHALNFGSSIRQTDSTAINAKSSRSHAIFSLNLVQKKSATAPTSRLDKRRSAPVDPLSNLDSAVTTDSKLHFVDLAGSERLKNTGAQGTRAKEGISINAGLASLGKVISQLSTRNQNAHISYRDSRLTRILQDSLGGDAFTYLIAAINPAEFHLSETLNTLSYAQKARAIQSRPHLQLTLTDADKNAVIDRLKAEIASLREIVGRDVKTPRSGGGDSTNHKASELQEQLMNMQENYEALSHRHDKLINELVVLRDDPTGLDDHASETATDRLQRSSSLSQAVENVIAEYEQTIKSLELSLSNTRGSLANTESALNERESRIAYLEAAAAQAQNRLKKMTDREAHTEQYLQELESQLEGVASSEESTATLIQGLRKELSRAKSYQNTTEEYVVSLEDRLAEAERESEMMKRDLERLEQLVDRQRGIGSADRQTPTMDSFIKPSVEKTPTPASINGVHPGREDSHPPASIDAATDGTPSSERASDPGSASSGRPLGLMTTNIDREVPADTETSSVSPPGHGPTDDLPLQRPQTPKQNGAMTEDRRAAQSTFMADKVETLTQELFDLRGEHETTLNDFDELRRKYAIALQSLAKAQDSHDKESPQAPSLQRTERSDSFLGGALPGAEPHHSRGESLQSLPSVYSSQPDFESSAFEEDSISMKKAPEASQQSSGSLPRTEGPTSLAQASVPTHQNADIEELQTHNHLLEEAHREALLENERLKAQLQRSQQPSPTVKSPFVRRKPSQDPVGTMGQVDRANRAFASLRNIALDHFEANPGIRQNFEMQLTTIMTELHAKTERVQEMDAELVTLRRQLEEKITIIAGLTRERSTLNSSTNLDYQAVSQMRDQLTESETQIKTLHEAHQQQEQRLQAEITTLKEHLEASRGEAKRSGVEISNLKDELSLWEEKHASLLRAMEASEANLMATITGLQTTLKSTTDTAENEKNRALGDAEARKSEHDAAVAKLQQEMQEHMKVGEQTTQRLNQLQQAHDDAVKGLEQRGRDRDVVEAELAKHRDLVADLQQQVQQHQASMAQHEESIQSIKEEHSRALSDLQGEVEKHQTASTGVLAGLAALLGQPVDSSTYETHVQKLVESKRELESRDVQASNEKKQLEDELKSVQDNNGQLQKKMDELKLLHEGAIKDLGQVTAREEKLSRLVAELEDQLNSNYDANAAQTNRFSSLHTSTQFQLQEAMHAKAELEKDVEEYRARVSYLESQLNAQRRSSTSVRADTSTFNTRESLSPEAAAIALARSQSASPGNLMRRASPPGDASALPSPPPAIPLPPLPTSSSTTNLSALPSVPDPSMTKQLEEAESRVRTVEKHLYAEKQLTATLEEALVDLEAAQNKTREDMATWRAKAVQLEDELIDLRKDKVSGRQSLQKVEEERELRMRAEAARRNLEERMKGLEQGGKKKKKGGLNCF